MTREKIKARGTIRWFSNESDQGFVRLDDGGREHAVGDGAASLRKGDRVTYDTAEGVRSLWARNVSRA